MPDYGAFVPAQRLRQSLALSPDGSTLAYASDASGQFNVWVQPTAGGSARQLTFLTKGSVRQLAWAPDASRIVFKADECGDEQTQIYLVSVAGDKPLMVSSGVRQHRLAEKAPFDPSGRYVLCGGNDRDPAIPDLIVFDLAQGNALRFPGIRGRTIFPLAVSPDSRWILAGGYAANSEMQCYLGDIQDPGKPLQPMTAHLDGVYHYPGPWDADSAGFYLRTTAGGRDQACLAHMSLQDQVLTIIDEPDWGVEDVAVSADGRTLAWVVNQDSRSVVRVQRDSSPVTAPAVPDGVVEEISLSADGATAAFLLDTPLRPREVTVADLAGGAPVRYLTDTRPPALRTVSPVAPDLIHFPAADGTPIPALLYRPAGTERCPAVLWLHGGPETQARPAYVPIHQYLPAHGIAVLVPNVRGSTGYGMAWRRIIYRDWGGIDLQDFASAAAYLRSLGWVDADRLGVMGTSYGGFAALSCVSRLPELWAAGVSVCGPANLETLARSMPADWANAVAANFGDPDKDGDKLRERSPVTYASQITAPLLIIQGARDPRVPKAEADQIVLLARTNGVEVTYMVFDDEGHGFTSRANDTKANTAIAEFLLDHLH
jgi:dipeptidyl aminopeptidase/acylaminoacyl peptidase